MGRATGQLAYARKMAWLMPRMAMAVPYLGYLIPGQYQAPPDSPIAPSRPKRGQRPMAALAWTRARCPNPNTRRTGHPEG